MPEVFTWEAFSLIKAHIKEKCSSWKTSHKFRPFTAQIQRYQNNVYGSEWPPHHCPFLAGFRFSLENSQQAKIKNCGLYLSNKDDVYSSRKLMSISATFHKRQVKTNLQHLRNYHSIYTTFYTAAGSSDRSKTIFLQSNIPMDQGPVDGWICLKHALEAAILRRCLYQIQLWYWLERKTGKMHREKFF